MFICSTGYGKEGIEEIGLITRGVPEKVSLVVHSKLLGAHSFRLDLFYNSKVQ